MNISFLQTLTEVFCALCVTAAGAVLLYRFLRPVPTALPPAGQRLRGRTLWQILLPVVLSRLFLFGYGALVQYFSRGSVAPFAQTYSMWDAHHYLHIAQHGYTADQSLGDGWLYIVFFPLFPALTALVRLLLQNTFLSGMAVSGAAALISCKLLYDLAEYEFPGSGKLSLAYLLCFPATVFLCIPYTESLYLALSIACLSCIRREKWLFAAILGFFAALARNVGALLAVAYGIQWLQLLRRRHRQGLPFCWKTAITSALPVLLIPLGTGLYLLLNYLVYGDALMFMQIQKDHWYQQMQWFYRSIGTTTAYALQGDWNMRLFLWLPQLGMMVLSLAALPWMLKKLPPAYGGYLLCYYLVILSPSWLLSYTRYLMAAAPIYLALPQISRKKWVHALLLGFLALWALYLFAGFALGQQVL